MCTAILAVWSKSTLKKCYGLVLVNKEGEIQKIYSLLKSKYSNDVEFVLSLFCGTINYTDTILYVTFFPSQIFIQAAKSKKIKKIIHLPSKNQKVISDPILEEFSSEFGRIIDLLSNFKLSQKNV